MHCNVWHDKNVRGTNLCDWHLTRIICINKTRTEKCHFTVTLSPKDLPRISMAMQENKLYSLQIQHTGP